MVAADLEWSRGAHTCTTGPEADAFGTQSRLVPSAARSQRRMASMRSSSSGRDVRLAGTSGARGQTRSSAREPYRLHLGSRVVGEMEAAHSGGACACPDDHHFAGRFRNFRFGDSRHELIAGRGVGDPAVTARIASLTVRLHSRPQPSALTRGLRDRDRPPTRLRHCRDQCHRWSRRPSLGT